MYADETTLEAEYKKGFDSGYKWLTRGWNFLHPYGSFTYASGHTIKGYFPGGPIYFPRAHTWEDKIRRQQMSLIHDLNIAWRNGWIDGINSYVRHNKLDYPMIVEGN